MHHSSFPKLEEILSDRIGNEEMSVRLSNGVWRLGFSLEHRVFENPTIRELLSLPEYKIKEVNGIGNLTLRELKAVFASKGIPLEEDIFQSPGKYLAKHSRIDEERVLSGERVFRELLDYLPFKNAITSYQSHKRIDYYIYHERTEGMGSFLEFLWFFESPESLYNQVRELASQGASVKEISEKTGWSLPFCYSFIEKWPEIGKGLNYRKERSHNQKVYEKVASLLQQGKNQREIARVRRVTRQAVSAYIKYHPELKKLKRK